VEEQNKATIKMLKMMMKINTENYRNKQSEAIKICTAIKKNHDLKVLEGMEKANKRNEAREFYTTAYEMKAEFQSRTSICKDRVKNLFGNDQLIMEDGSSILRNS